MNARFYSARTLQLESGRRGKEREGRRENLGKCKRREKKERKRRKRSGDSGEMSRENEWERGGGRERKEKREKNRGIPSVLNLQIKHCLKDTFRCRYWLCFFLKSPPVAVNVTDL